MHSTKGKKISDQIEPNVYKWAQCVLSSWQRLAHTEPCKPQWAWGIYLECNESQLKNDRSVATMVVRAGSQEKSTANLTGHKALEIQLQDALK